MFLHRVFYKGIGFIVLMPHLTPHFHLQYHSLPLYPAGSDASLKFLFPSPLSVSFLLMLLTDYFFVLLVLTPHSASYFHLQFMFSSFWYSSEITSLSFLPFVPPPSPSSPSALTQHSLVLPQVEVAARDLRRAYHRRVLDVLIKSVKGALDSIRRHTSINNPRGQGSAVGIYRRHTFLLFTLNAMVHCSVLISVILILYSLLNGRCRTHEFSPLPKSLMKVELVWICWWCHFDLRLTVVVHLFILDFHGSRPSFFSEL